MTPFTSLMLAWLLNAFWPIVAKRGTNLFSGELFAHAGLLIGLFCIAPWLFRKNRWSRVFSPEIRSDLFWIGLWGTAIPTVLYVAALEYTTPANAGILAQIEVLYSAALCAWLLKESVPIGQMAGSILVLAGTWLIVHRDLTSIRWKGDLMILMTPWMFQIAHIRAKRLPADLDPITLAGSRLFYGSICLVPASIWMLWHSAKWDGSAAGVSMLLAQGIGMSFLSYLTWYKAMRGMDLAKATTVLLSYPALTTLLSWWSGAEILHTAQVCGLILTLSGAYWVSLLALKSQRVSAIGEKLPVIDPAV